MFTFRIVNSYNAGHWARLDVTFAAIFLFATDHALGGDGPPDLRAWVLMNFVETTWICGMDILWSTFSIVAYHNGGEVAEWRPTQGLSRGFRVTLRRELTTVIERGEAEDRHRERPDAVGERFRWTRYCKKDPVRT